MTTTWGGVRQWDREGRSGYSSPSESYVGRGSDEARVAFCWFEGEFSGFPVAPGAEAVFRYVAYTVDSNGQAAPLVATNTRPRPEQGPRSIDG